MFARGLRDERVVAAVPMASRMKTTFFGTKGCQSVAIPVLYMSGTDDPVGAPELFAQCDAIDLTWIEIEGACHQAFALGFCDQLDTEEGFSIINAFMRFSDLGAEWVLYLLMALGVIMVGLFFERLYFSKRF